MRLLQLLHTSAKKSTRDNEPATTLHHMEKSNQPSTEERGEGLSQHFSPTRWEGPGNHSDFVRFLRLADWFMSKQARTLRAFTSLKNTSKITICSLRQSLYWRATPATIKAIRMLIRNIVYASMCRLSLRHTTTGRLAESGLIEYYDLSRSSCGHAVTCVANRAYICRWSISCNPYHLHNFLCSVVRNT